MILPWLTYGGGIAAAEPILIGEAILIVGTVVLVGVVIYQAVTYADKMIEDNSKTIVDKITFETSGIGGEEIKSQSDYNPNPYSRPGEKKQNRENRNKSRTKDGWQPRNNRRDGKPAKQKSHTPSKKGHKKYFDLNNPIKIY